MKKIISCVLTLLMVFSMFTIVNATGGIITSPVTPDIGNPEMKTMTEEILGIVYYACMAVSMGMLIYVGIRYMMASANEKADVKSASVKYLIGAIVLFTATNLFKIILSIAEEVAPTA
ncbi:MAG: hypothetical protein IJX99_04360 [Clostridia bacterium]|nr:hypothetical protein [Clostridia bacterium]